MLDFMVPLNDGRKVVTLGFEIISKLDSYFLMTVKYPVHQSHEIFLKTEKCERFDLF